MSKVKIDSLSSEVMKELEKYADVTTEKVKKAVKNAGKTVRDEISSAAPSNTGKYGKSWTVKTVRETSSSLELVVHSKIDISLPIFLSLVMQSVVVAEYLQDLIFQQLKKRR